MSKKTILLITGISLLLIVIFYQLALKKEEQTFDLFEVVRGNIHQEVSEVGQLKKGEEINLALKTSGRIERIYVNVGDEVKKWTTLAKIDTKGLEIQLQQAESDLVIYQAKLDKLLTGITTEEIQKAETVIFNAQISLENAQQNLENVKVQSEENLAAAYENALSVLDNSYLKIYNAFLIADSFQEEYFYYQDEESVRVKINRNAIEEAMFQARFFLDAVKNDQSYENIDAAISEIKSSLVIVFESLSFIRETSEDSIHSYIISATGKASLDTERTIINNSLTDITNV